MPNILALDTATDACSVAVSIDGDLRSLYELIPRQHNQRLFPMLRELLPNGDLRTQGIECLAYNHGPGSFTGLRIAASAIQGMAYSNQLPVVGVSTLACMAQGAIRCGLVPAGAAILVLLDARINEVYRGLYQAAGDSVEALLPDSVCAPAQLVLDIDLPGGGLIAVGNGLRYEDELPALLRSRIDAVHPTAWPDSIDLMTLAKVQFGKGELLQPQQVQPIYLRDDIGWKKLSEQGVPKS